jgi:lysophospholipase L1-like esterase
MLGASALAGGAPAPLVGWTGATGHSRSRSPEDSLIRSLRAVAALLAAACSLAGASAAHAKTLDVTLLGDSYSAGVGGGDSTGSPCYRSPNTWGEAYGVLARATGLTVNVTNLACGGAEILGDTPDEGLDKQIPTVPTNTDLVLLTIGGNDAGFGNMVPWCFTAILAGPNNCRIALENGKKQIPTVEANLTARLRELRARLPLHAKVVLLTYPYLAMPSGYLLTYSTTSYDSGAVVREWGDLLDDATVRAADAASPWWRPNFARVVSTKARFADHEPDQNPWATNPDTWILEFRELPEIVDFYHPSATGYEEMAEEVFAQAGPGGDFGAAR